MARKTETTSPRVSSDAAWLLKNWPRIQRAMAGVIGSALSQAPDRRVGPRLVKAAKQAARMAKQKAAK